MSAVIVRLLIVMACAVGLTWAIGVVSVIAAGVAARLHRADRCRCGLMDMTAHDGTEVVAWTHEGVRHERQRCCPTREVTR